MTGWTWDQVRDTLDLPRVRALRNVWKLTPNTWHLQKAAAEALGVEFKGGSVTAPANAPPPAFVTDPNVFMADIGGLPERTYVAPARGLPTTPQGSE